MLEKALQHISVSWLFLLMQSLFCDVKPWTCFSIRAPTGESPHTCNCGCCLLLRGTLITTDNAIVAQYEVSQESFMKWALTSLNEMNLTILRQKELRRRQLQDGKRALQIRNWISLQVLSYVRGLWALSETHAHSLCWRTDYLSALMLRHREKHINEIVAAYRALKILIIVHVCLRATYKIDECFPCGSRQKLIVQ